jgi:hypothetical protein
LEHFSQAFLMGSPRREKSSTLIDPVASLAMPSPDITSTTTRTQMPRLGRATHTTKRREGRGQVRSTHTHDTPPHTTEEKRREEKRREEKRREEKRREEKGRYRQ